MKFKVFIDLIAPLFVNDAAEISNSVLRSTFDRLFDQNSNGKVEQQEIASLLILLQGFDTYKHNLSHENRTQILNNRNNQIAFKGKNIQERATGNHPFYYLEFYDFVKCGYLRDLFMN